MTEPTPMTDEVVPVPLFDAGLGGYVPSSAVVYMDSANDRIFRANARIDRLRAELASIKEAVVELAPTSLQVQLAAKEAECERLLRENLELKMQPVFDEYRP